MTAVVESKPEFPDLANSIAVEVTRLYFILCRMKSPASIPRAP
jgi:hypothetical protein